MDAYRLGGGREVEKLILDQFSVFMYNEGRGKEITRTEYLKWKLRGKTRDEVGNRRGQRRMLSWGREMRWETDGDRGEC